MFGFGRQQSAPAAKPTAGSDHPSSTTTFRNPPGHEDSTFSNTGSNANGRAKLDPDAYGGSGKYPRISKPVELMRHEYDVVVIGSGYGGGVAASRMARGGQSVCLLELGKERWPGEYPTSVTEALPELHVSGSFAPHDRTGKPVETGNPQGLYHLMFGEGQNAFVGNGLGGTSLLNANVFLEPTAPTLQQAEWPEEITLDELDPYFRRARDVLEPAVYPHSYPDLPKLDLLEKQAINAGFQDNFRRVEQTTRFVDGPNSTGVYMQGSQLTGMDSTGVNDGSKSSTLVNYLADAWNWGAELFCDCEVRYIEKHPTEGWLVFFAWHGGKRGKFRELFYEDLMFIHAKKFVFLGAGALGTTEILLRSKQKSLSMSGRVGQYMSGNGDILAFGYNTDEKANAVGCAFPDQENPIGPTITGIIDNRGQPYVLDDYVIEEGAIPAALAPLLQPMLAYMSGKVRPDLNTSEKLAKIMAGARSVLLGPYAKDGAVERTMVYLIMSHDSNQAAMRLEQNKPVIAFQGVGRSDHVKQLNETLADMTNAVGGTYVNSPFFAMLGEQEITVHPIGGANMSRDNTSDMGVTTHEGQLLSGNGKEVHDGIYITDAAVIPSALGANPFATITALAERTVERAAASKKIKIDLKTKNDQLDLFGLPARALPPPDQVYSEAVKTVAAAQDQGWKGFSFTEVMEGFFHIGPGVQDFDTAEAYGRGSATMARFFLSVRAWNTDTLVHQRDHKAMLTGTFTCGAMPGKTFMVRRGTFQLFNSFSRAADTKNLTYDFDMISTTGEKLHFRGYKVINSSVAFSVSEVWKAETTLFVTITKPDKSVYARGKLHIKAKDLVREVESMSATGRSTMQKIKSSASFLGYFTYQTASFFFAPFAKLHYPSAIAQFNYKKSPPTQSWQIFASDNVPSQMYMWEPKTRSADGRIKKVLLIGGASVDHQVFALPTIKENAIEFFTRKGLQCYTVTHRVGLTPVAMKNYTTYDARLDIKAALQSIRERQGSDEPVYVIAHCAGSMALALGLLDDDVNTRIPAEWISGISASNVFADPIPGKVNDIKARLPISLVKVYKSMMGNWYSCNTSTHDALLQRALNQLLRFYPVGLGAGEICQNTVCHRSELPFGRLWSHRNLNAETHASLSRFVGGISMDCLWHFTQMCRSQKVLTNKDAEMEAPEPHTKSSIYTKRNVRNMRGIPIFFFSGTENVVFTPEATMQSFTVFTNVNGNPDLTKLDNDDSDIDGSQMSDHGSSTSGDEGDEAAPPSSEDDTSRENSPLLNGSTPRPSRPSLHPRDGSSSSFRHSYDFSRPNNYRPTPRSGPMYTRRTFDGRGHLDCWMSDNSHDVYRAVLDHINKVA